MSPKPVSATKNFAEAAKRVDYIQDTLERIQSMSGSTCAMLYPQRVLYEVGEIAKDALDFLFDQRIHEHKGERDVT